MLRRDECAGAREGERIDEHAREQRGLGFEVVWRRAVLAWITLRRVARPDSLPARPRAQATLRGTEPSRTGASFLSARHRTTSQIVSRALLFSNGGRPPTISPNPEGSEYWQRLRLDAQVSDAFAGARSLGYEVAGCYYDVIAKPRLAPLAATPPEKRQYTKKDGRLYAGQRESDETPYEYRTRLDEHIAEKPERYYARAVAPRVEADEIEALLDTWNTARDIREADLALRQPRNPDACKGWGRLCEFFAVCTGEADVNDAGMFRSAGDVSVSG